MSELFCPPEVREAAGQPTTLSEVGWPVGIKVHTGVKLLRYLLSW